MANDKTDHSLGRSQAQEFDFDEIENMDMGEANEIENGIEAEDPLPSTDDVSENVAIAEMSDQLHQLQLQLENGHSLFLNSGLNNESTEQGQEVNEDGDSDREYAALDQTLNQLDSCLDDLEQKNDDLNAKLRALLASSRQEYDQLLSGSGSSTAKPREGGADGTS